MPLKLEVLLTVTVALTAETAFSQTPTPGSSETSPPPTNVEYFQYGVLFAAHTVASANDVCATGTDTPCILGSGGGPGIRVGYRSRGPWYVGGIYEFSRHDSANLLRLAILQQLRAEGRYYAEMGTRLSPYALMGAGFTIYGNEWTAETAGLVGALGAGFEFQISETAVVGMSLTYRPFLLRGWTDSAGARRADQHLGFGTAHLITLELVFEVREPLPRW